MKRKVFATALIRSLSALKTCWCLFVSIDARAHVYIEFDYLVSTKSNGFVADLMGSVFFLHWVVNEYFSAWLRF